jgi:hypothetical protein
VWLLHERQGTNGARRMSHPQMDQLSDTRKGRKRSSNGKPAGKAAKSSGLLGLLAGIHGTKRIHMPRALDPLGSIEPSGLPFCQPSQAITK